MKAEATQYRLCNMVLINIGTNKHKPSGRITAVDPRGGAAVLGDNGVGKTTTLRLLPLFFGHLHSAIVDPQKGQQNMVRFVLPNDTSAIAFEYQRGSSDPKDLRLAVIRRRSDDPDSLCYRLYKSGYRQDLFVQDGRFLSDDETQKMAIALGLQTFRRLSSADYRHVILRTPATSKDKALLRSLSLDFSFGPRPLDNLDRVVAAMVKKHVSFSDIVQVAVSLAQSDMGQGGEAPVLAYKQGKSQIDQWVRSRQACKDSFALEPEVTKLHGSLAIYRQMEAQMRAARGDIEALQVIRTQEAGDLSTKLAQAELARQDELTKENTHQESLTQRASDATEASKEASHRLEQASDRFNYFTKQRAEHYEREMSRLGGLREALTVKNSQLEALLSEKTNLTTHFEKITLETRQRVGVEQLELERSKEPFNLRLTTGLEAVGIAEAGEIRALEEEIDARRHELDLQKTPLQDERGRWNQRAESPAASAEADSALEKAIRDRHTHQQLMLTLQTQVSADLQKYNLALSAHSALEVKVQAARDNLSQVGQALSDAQQFLAPAPSSFLAALRSSPDESWRRDLARVIDVKLLANTDLGPSLVDEGSPTLYGWKINTGVLPQVDWADESAAKVAVAELEAAQTRAQLNLNALLSELASAETTRKAAETTHHLSSADLDAKKSRTADLQQRVEAATQRVEREKSDAVRHAKAEVSRLNDEISAVESQLKGLDPDRKRQAEAINKRHEATRQELRAANADSVGAIDLAIQQVGQRLEQAIKALDDQLKAQLSEAGVNPVRHDELQREVVDLRRDIEELESKSNLVKEWRLWQETVGVAGLKQLEGIARQRAQELTNATQTLTTHTAAMLSSSEKHLREQQILRAQLEKRNKDLELLSEALIYCSDYSSDGQSTIDTDANAQTLKSQAHTLANKIQSGTHEMGRTIFRLRQALTSKPSPVSELIDSVLTPVANEDVYRQASELCQGYRLIGPQIVTNVNLTLRILLENITAFQKSLQSFEREIRGFNTRLQEGLSEVQCFERVKDLRLDITTNFDSLGRFYRRLGEMGSVAREVALTSAGMDSARELPSDDVERALREFANELRVDGTFEVSLAKHITLRGEVTDNGKHKDFANAERLESISSEGLTSLILITLMTALLNTIRGSEPVHVPWVTDEVGKYDPGNFRALMQRLQDNRIDVVTASPELGPAQQALFAHRYLFEDHGRIRIFQPKHPHPSAQPPTEPLLSPSSIPNPVSSDPQEVSL